MRKCAELARSYGDDWHTRTNHGNVIPMPDPDPAPAEDPGFHRFVQQLAAARCIYVGPEKKEGDCGQCITCKARNVIARKG